MKLIGTRTEEQVRKELVTSHESLVSGVWRKLTAALTSLQINVATAYIVHWIPEQAEDIFVILVSRDDVVTVEVPRDEGSISANWEKLSAYERKASKHQRLKIAIAKELLNAASGPR